MEDKENPFHVFYDSYLNTNACTECTGLIPSLAEDDRLISGILSGILTAWKSGRSRNQKSA